MATRTDVQARVTKTAAFAGASLAIDTITGDWTLKIRVAKLTPGGAVRINFEDSVNAFTALLPGPAVSVKNQQGDDYDRVFEFRKYDFPSLRFGTASAVLRCNLQEITGASPSVDYEAWLEQ